MHQHLIAIDLDGTTLNKASRVSPLTLQTLRALDALGHMVCIVTGRPYRTSKEIYHYLGIDSPIVNFNGALCHFPDRPQWLAYFHQELDRELAFDLLANQEKLNIDMIAVEGKDQLFTSTMNLPDSPFYPKDKAQIELLSRKTLKRNPTALAVFCALEQQETIRQQILREYGDKVSVRTWGGVMPVLEIVHEGINKAVGLAQIANFYHIPQDHILAFGDENNDLEMLEYAGLGVAMANATDEVKAIANDQTALTNDQDGLANYLIDYFHLSR